MKLYFTKEVSFFYKLNYLDDLSDQFDNYSFGKGVSTIYILLHCVDPEMGLFRDFETGFPLRKRYIKSKKQLEFGYKLNFKQFNETQTREQELTIILEGFKKTYHEIKELEIKDFDIDKFYAEVSSVIENFAISKIEPKKRFFNHQFNEINMVSDQPKMDETIFWNIIDKSKEESENFEHQIQLIIDKLCILTEKDIIGFEFTFRELLALSCHYNILAAAKIIFNHVSDDDFLYFRCRLIAEGKDFYYKIIENPDNMVDIFDASFEGELMLSISDRAFIKKFGKNTNLELPREIALSYMRYCDLCKCIKNKELCNCGFLS